MASLIHALNKRLLLLADLVHNERLSHLVTSGLGNFEIRELILNHNPLGEGDLLSFKEYSVTYHKFRNFKKVSLRAIKLQDPICLEYIENIVRDRNALQRRLEKHSPLL